MAVVIGGKTYYFMLEVCRGARISRSTLLRWLKRDVIQEPLNDRRGWRIFSEEELKRISSEVGRTR
jgi:predicted site-specific integrase-resolvase